MNAKKKNEGVDNERNASIHLGVKEGAHYPLNVDPPLPPA